MTHERGIAPIAIVILVVVVLFAGGFFFLQKGGKTPTSILPSALSLNANCKFNDADLCKYVNRTLNGDYFTKGVSMKSQTKDKAGKVSSEVLSETENTGKMHMVMSQNGKELTNTITIDKTIYMKDPKDGKWWKQTLEETTPEQSQKVGEQFDLDKYKKEFKEEQDKTTFKKVGKEACGDHTCFKYQIINPQMADVIQYVLFDDREYPLRKMITESKDGGVTEVIFEFGGVSVQVPSPTKDVPKGQNIYMMMGQGMMDDSSTKQNYSPQGGPSEEEVNKMMQEMQKKYAP